MTNSVVREIARLREAPIEALLEAYKRVFGEPSGLLSRTQVWKKIAWRLQADAARDRPPAEPRPGELVVPLIRTARSEPQRQPANPRHRDLPIGTELRREWHGREVVVRVVEDGFEHEGVPYRSLTAVARAITHSHWPGPLFFNLVKRKRGARST